MILGFYRFYCRVWGFRGSGVRAEGLGGLSLGFKGLGVRILGFGAQGL